MDVKGYFKLFQIEDIAKIREADLKRKYRLLAIKFHPDKGGSAAQFRFIKEAYDYLIVKRQNYSKRKKQGVQFTVSPDKNFYHYGDGSIFDVEKNRWKRYNKHGKWYVWDYKPIRQIDCYA